MDIEGQAEWEVEAVMGHRKRKKNGRKAVTHYLVRWKGYGPDNDTWEPVGNLENCKGMVQAYWSGLKK